MDELTILAGITVALTVGLLIVAIFSAVSGPDSVAIARLARMKRRGSREMPHENSLLAGNRLSSIPLLDFLFARSRSVGKMTLELERAGLNLRVSEYIAMRLIAAVLAFVVTFALLHSSAVGLPIAIVAGLAGSMLPSFWVKLRKTRRLQKLEKQLPETLTIMSNSLKAGFGFLQAIDAAAQQMRPPMAAELNRALRDANLGASIDEALRAMVERVKSPDLDLAVTAILIQREVGGNLAELLDNVAHTIRERERIKGEIKTLTTTQRWEGFVAAAIPIFLAGLLFAVNPDYMSTLTNETAGQILLAAAVIWEVIGFFVTKKIVDIEV